MKYDITQLQKLIFIDCSENDRLNVKGSTSDMMSNGWEFDFTDDNSDFQNAVGLVCNVQGTNAMWFGWSSGSQVGTLSAVLQGEGTVTLDFGNCWGAGIVNVYLDSTLRASAPVGTKSLIKSFSFTSGSVLKIKDENGNAVVMLNSIQTLCNGMFIYAQGSL